MLPAAQNCLNSFAAIGSAVAANGCYRLTSAGVRSSAGAMWSNQPINLSYNFEVV